MAPPTLASIAAPAPVAAPAPAPAPRKENAKEKAAIDRGLAEVRVERVRVDGLALMKIIKHSLSSHSVIPAPAGTSNATATFSPAVGQLLGIDSDGTLEISNAFALPSGALGSSSTSGEGDITESKGVKAANKYTNTLLTRLADINYDASLVGFYTSSNNGQHLALPGFIEALLAAQMSGGGLGSGVQQSKAIPVGRTSAAPSKSNLASGTESKSGKGIALVYDVASAPQGNVGLRAFRLTPEFIETYRGGKFDTASLIAHKLVPSTILQELPVTLHSTALLTAFLSTLPQSTPTYAPLTLPTSSLASSLTSLLTSLETHQAHLSTLSFQSRQLARDRARVESLPNVVRRRTDNEQRAKEGLPSLGLTEEEKALIEPSRLETMCALAAVEGASRSLAEEAGIAVVRSYGAKAGVV